MESKFNYGETGRRRPKEVQYTILQTQNNYPTLIANIDTCRYKFVV